MGLILRPPWRLPALSLLVAALLAGCAWTTPLPPQTTVKPVAAERPGASLGWRTAAFQLDWPEESDPAWHLDLLLAHRVVGPVLGRFADRVALWRFHRRAVRDRIGHQFSFLFYSDAATAARLLAALGDDALLSALEAHGRVRRAVFSDPKQNLQPGVADTGDRSWSEPVRRTWPHFIMGASRMWLGLIEASAAAAGPPPPAEDLERLEDFYRRIDDRVSDIWRQEGGHALLHHLNAIFGYRPLEVHQRSLQQF